MSDYTLSYILLSTIICSNPAAWDLDPDVTTVLADALAGYASAFLESPVIVRVLLCITG